MRTAVSRSWYSALGTFTDHVHARTGLALLTLMMSSFSLCACATFSCAFSLPGFLFLQAVQAEVAKFNSGCHSPASLLLVCTPWASCLTAIEFALETLPLVVSLGRASADLFLPRTTPCLVVVHPLAVREGCPGHILQPRRHHHLPLLRHQP